MIAETGAPRVRWMRNEYPVSSIQYQLFGHAGFAGLR